MSELVKVLLLSGEYNGMENVSFPVVVCAHIDCMLAEIPSYELNRIGCDMEWFSGDETWPFIIGTECEIIND